MSNILYSRIFHINSTNRITGNNGNFSYSIQIPTELDFDFITLLQANIPISYYLIQIGSNTFQLQEGLSVVTITIPQGNYNINSFSLSVAQLLTTFSPNAWTYSITYNNDFNKVNDGKLYYSVTGNTSQPLIIMPSGSSPIYEQFGFNIHSINQFNSNKLVSSNVVKFVPEDSLLLHCSLVNNGTNENNLSNDVLQTIYNNNLIPFSNAVWINPQPYEYSKPLTRTKEKVINFYLTDENSNPIFLNGLNMNLTIMIFRRQNFYEIQKEYIKSKILEE